MRLGIHLCTSEATAGKQKEVRGVLWYLRSAQECPSGLDPIPGVTQSPLWHSNSAELMPSCCFNSPPNSWCLQSSRQGHDSNEHDSHSLVGTLNAVSSLSPFSARLQSNSGNPRRGSVGFSFPCAVLSVKHRVVMNVAINGCSMDTRPPLDVVWHSLRSCAQQHPLNAVLPQGCSTHPPFCHPSVSYTSQQCLFY